MLFHRAICKLIGCASTDITRTQLNGLHVEESNGRIHGCATSGKTLAYASHPVPAEDEFPATGVEKSDVKSFWLSTFSIKKLAKLLSRRKALKPILDNVEVEQAGGCRKALSTFDADLDATTLRVSDNDHMFPEYGWLFEDKVEKVVKLDPRYLLEAVKTMLDTAAEFGEKFDEEGSWVELRLPKGEGKPVQLHWTKDDIVVKTMTMPLVTK